MVLIHTLQLKTGCEFLKIEYVNLIRLYKFHHHVLMFPVLLKIAKILLICLILRFVAPLGHIYETLRAAANAPLINITGHRNQAEHK